MTELRVFDRISRQMQRLGYLKRLIRRVTSTTTSNLDNLGNDLIEIAMHKVKIPLSKERANYIKIRLYDRVYKTLKDQADQWLSNGGDPPLVQMELQDVYLSDSSLPSQVGKLVKEDWRSYPPLGLNLGLIRVGTYSANTRALSLLYFTPEVEHQAFVEYLPGNNPFLLNKKQVLLFLYAMLENDGEVIAPLWARLHRHIEASFTDRELGDYLPDIYRAILARYRVRMLTIDLRNRLDILEKSAENIAAQREKERYAGGTAREHASRPRIEPYVDMGLFSKPNPMRYEYSFSAVGRYWASVFSESMDSQQVGEFLLNNFFQTAARAWEIDAPALTTLEGIVPYLRRAAKAINSPGGYAPIEELALVAGIEALLDDHRRIEIVAARQALIAYQKANPYQLRFTVDRLGTLAHVRFMDESAS